MSGVRDKDGVVHLAMMPGQLPIVLAHCDAIGANRTGQSWHIDDLVEDPIACVHCLADVRKSLGLDEPSSKTPLMDAYDDLLKKWS